jgi:hypothetical protein
VVNEFEIKTHYGGPQVRGRGQTVTNGPRPKKVRPKKVRPKKVPAASERFRLWGVSGHGLEKRKWRNAAMALGHGPETGTFGHFFATIRSSRASKSVRWCSKIEHACSEIEHERFFTKCKCLILRERAVGTELALKSNYGATTSIPAETLHLGRGDLPNFARSLAAHAASPAQ